MKKIINKNEGCSKAVLVTGKQLENLQSWHRVNYHTQFIGPRDEFNHNITAKEEIQFVYDIIYNHEYDIFMIEDVYSPKEVSAFIEDLYSELPETRVIKFIVTDTPMETTHVYYFEDCEEVIGLYDSLLDITESDIELQDKFIYSVDITHELFRINNDCESIKENLIQIMNHVDDELNVEETEDSDEEKSDNLKTKIKTKFNDFMKAIESLLK